MSMMIPPELGSVARIAVGQDFPRGNEDKLAELGAVWNATAQELNQVLSELNPATAATFESLAGAPAEQFAQFVNELSSTLPVMATSAAQLGQMAEEIALEIEYAKYMIILQLAWMAAEIAYLSATLFGAAAIPAVITAGRFAVQTILRELFVAVVSSIVIQVGMDVAVQVIQFLKGDRTHWDANTTLSMFEMGALGGLVGGGLGQIMRHLAPEFTKSFLGSLAHGALTGLGTTELSNLAFHADGDLGLGTAAGGLGGAISTVTACAAESRRSTSMCRRSTSRSRRSSCNALCRACASRARPSARGRYPRSTRPGSSTTRNTWTCRTSRNVPSKNTSTSRTSRRGQRSRACRTRRPARCSRTYPPPRAGRGRCCDSRCSTASTSSARTPARPGCPRRSGSRWPTRCAVRPVRATGVRRPGV